MPQGAQQVQISSLGGQRTALNVTAAGVISAKAGTLFRVLVVTAGTAGALTINDLSANTGAAAANTLLSVPFGNLTAGQVITIEASVLNGIVVSAVPNGGQFTITYT